MTNTEEKGCLLARECSFGTLKEVLEFLQGPLNREISISKLKQDSASRKFPTAALMGGHKPG